MRLQDAPAGRAHWRHPVSVPQVCNPCSPGHPPRLSPSRRPVIAVRDPEPCPPGRACWCPRRLGPWGVADRRRLTIAWLSWPKAGAMRTRPSITTIPPVFCQVQLRTELPPAPPRLQLTNNLSPLRQRGGRWGVLSPSRNGRASMSYSHTDNILKRGHFQYIQRCTVDLDRRRCVLCILAVGAKCYPATAP